MGAEKDLFLNRDLSWLSFNHRVLLEAADPTVPLFSRISFLSIFSSNLDEFFRVRMPAIFAFTDIKAGKTNLREEYPKDLVEAVQQLVHGQLEDFGRILTKQLLPALKEEHIHLYYGDVLQPEHREFVKEYFLSRVLSFLQPVMLKKDRPDDVFLENNILYFIVQLEAEGKTRYALLNIPSANLPRFLVLPASGGDQHILFLDDVIRENIGLVFPDHVVSGLFSVKMTRDAEMDLQDEFVGDIAEKIEKQLEKRDAGRSTRFLYQPGMPAQMQEFLQGYLSIRAEEFVQGGRYHNLKDLGGLPNPSCKRLTFENWSPVPHPGFHTDHSVFDSVNASDQLLHLPYHSYNTILRFFNEAAIDPKVKEIFVTLYRVASDSHIVHALISAAKNGKKVTVFVELKARFDEANNLRWSKEMKAAGIRIINSIPGLKVHAKVALVRRYENKEWKDHSFMATGNFNESTGRFYTDHVLFTSDPSFAVELTWLFEYLQSRKQPADYMKIPFRHLLVSQFNMIKRFGELIDREIAHVRAGKPGYVLIKLNNLQEKEMISKLYEASRAGVKVELIVRSICCLAPGVPGQSENITVRRIVDRYLEHARIFVFGNDGQPEYFMGSADWMNRNLHSRIEVVFPVYKDELKKQLQQILDLQLNDTRKSVMLKSDTEKGSCENVMLNGVGVPAQEGIYNMLAASYKL